MLSEIGSNFWINPKELLKNEIESINPLQYFNIKGFDYVWMSTGRSAIRFVIKTIEERNPLIKKVVLLPPFTCHTVIEPFVTAGYTIYYYPIDDSLRVKSSQLLDCINKFGANLILIHRYFGFNTLIEDKEIFNELRQRNIVTIEDYTQSLFSLFSVLDTDYHIASIRKWFGVPDGGFAVCRTGIFNNKPIESDKQLEKLKMDASIDKYNYLFKKEGEKEDFLAKYSLAEEWLDNQNNFYTISNVSKLLLANLNKDELICHRRLNYQLLLDTIPNNQFFYLLYDTFDECVVPLYFPIYVKNRLSLQKYFVENNIYAPIVWPFNDFQQKSEDIKDKMYQHLLCIPIDQRYGEDDVLRIISVMKSFINDER